MTSPHTIASVRPPVQTSLDDLGTPLVLNVTNLLAPQAYLRVTSIGLEDPIGYVICVILVVFSIAAMSGAIGRRHVLRRRPGDHRGKAGG